MVCAKRIWCETPKPGGFGNSWSTNRCLDGGDRKGQNGISCTGVCQAISRHSWRLEATENHVKRIGPEKSLSSCPSVGGQNTRWRERRQPAWSALPNIFDHSWEVVSLKHKLMNSMQQRWKKSNLIVSLNIQIPKAWFTLVVKIGDEFIIYFCKSNVLFVSPILYFVQYSFTYGKKRKSAILKTSVNQA